jgi:hypothetical protein
MVANRQKGAKVVKSRSLRNFPGLALFLALTPSALASTIWYVNGVSGSDSNNCMSSQTACRTIGHAISLASSDDSLMVAAATYTENLTIGFSLNVVGSGANTTIIDGGGVKTVVTVSSTSAVVTLSNLTIRNGSAYGGAGIANFGILTIHNSALSGNRAVFGGGISNAGSATINNSTISGNSAQSSPHCLYHQLCGAFGGGIYNSNSATLTISSSTVRNNSAGARAGSCFSGGYCYSDGGGIFNQGTMIMSNTTVADNTASWTPYGTYGLGHGGGIFNSGTATISNCTLFANDATSGGGIFNSGTATTSNCTLSGNNAFSGVGISNNSGASMALQNSILDHNFLPGSVPQSQNCSGTMNSLGYNLSSDGTCSFNSPGDLNNHDPLLGPLQNNGGPTQTMALLPGSPAIDGGNPAGCTDGLGNPLKTDQRGMPRPDKEDTGGCDMGAYESQND